MGVLERYLSVTMIREHLENIPQFPLLSGFSIRWFQDGDEQVWQQVQSVTEPKYSNKQCW